MPEITIKYFDIKGRAEPIRLALAIGDIPFNDVRLSGPEFNKLKTETNELPFGQLPIMIVDGKTITQSEAILRYCGKLSGLYPKDDDLKAAKVDEMIGAIGDMMMSMFKGRGMDQDKMKEARKEFCEVDLKKFGEGIARICGKDDKGKYLCGDEPMICDLGLYYVVWNVKQGNVDYVDKDVFDKYPKILKSYKAVSEHPKVVEWNKAHPVKAK
eukprot:Plantae.Rhodophyta-Hildenbrandia_rubra.ctg7423.p1 GENE.Plantae.Rhodophyta-Hildenbrandia_rubra.ctg7423~~Plantae.Rhodophyta-Hildenbrandia_rubra.ctg7423.p1  ORF type:complete len:213 (+),score=52.20 Plantae.Rhodophyta-Hildenbrandia_rubra.ctg7423:69-707(+)